MLRILVPFLIVSLAASCRFTSSALSEKSRQAVVEEITEAVGRLEEAMNANDAARVLDFYEIDADFIYVSCTDVFLGTRYRTVAGLYFRPSRGVTFDLELVQLKVLSADAAVATIVGSSNRAPHLFWTQVWIRDEDRGWLITQVHQSWPGCEEPRAPHPGTAVPDTLELPPEDISD